MRVQKPIIHAVDLHALGVDGGRVQFLDVLDRSGGEVARRSRRRAGWRRAREGRGAPSRCAVWTQLKWQNKEMAESGELRAEHTLCESEGASDIARVAAAPPPDSRPTAGSERAPPLRPAHIRAAVRCGRRPERRQQSGAERRTPSSSRILLRAATSSSATNKRARRSAARQPGRRARRRRSNDAKEVAMKILPGTSGPPRGASGASPSRALFACRRTASQADYPARLAGYVRRGERRRRPPEHPRVGGRCRSTDRKLEREDKRRDRDHARIATAR